MAGPELAVQAEVRDAVEEHEEGSSDDASGDSVTGSEDCSADETESCGRVPEETSYEAQRRENIQRNHAVFTALGLTDVVGRFRSQDPAPTEVVCLSSPSPAKKQNSRRKADSADIVNLSDEDFLKRPRRSARKKVDVQSTASKRLTRSLTQKGKARSSKGKSSTSDGEEGSEYRASEETSEEEEEESESEEDGDEDEAEIDEAHPQTPAPPKKRQIPSKDPTVWEVRRRNKKTPSKSPASRPPRPPRKPLKASKSGKASKMSSDTWSGENYHNFSVDEPDFQNRPVPGYGMGGRGSNVLEHADRAGAASVSELEVEIAEKELAILNKRRALQMQHGGSSGQGTSMAATDQKRSMKMYDSEQRSKRRFFDRQMKEEIPSRESYGRKRYTVDVNGKGKPVGKCKGKWMTSLRGHSADLDFSLDHYADHDVAELLKIKQRVDSTFDYRGGVGQVTEEAFHSKLKGQLKMKRYQMKKLMVEGRPKPDHISPEHWENLELLIADTKKQEESSKLKLSRSKVKNISVAGRSEDEVRANLAMELERSPTRQELECELGREKGAKRRKLLTSSAGLSAGASRYDDKSPSSRVSDVLVEQNLDLRIKSLESGMTGLKGDMTGLQSNMELIMAHFKIPVRNSLAQEVSTKTASSAGHSTANPDDVEDTKAEEISVVERSSEVQPAGGGSDPYDIAKDSVEEDLHGKDDVRRAEGDGTKDDAGRAEGDGSKDDVGREEAADKSGKQVEEEQDAGKAAVFDVPEAPQEEVKNSKQELTSKAAAAVENLKAQDIAAKKKNRTTEVEKLQDANGQRRSARSIKGTATKTVKERQVKVVRDVKKATKEKAANVKGGTSNVDKAENVPKKSSKASGNKEPGVFARGDVVKLVGIAEGEEEKVVADAQIVSTEGGTLHCIPINEGCASVQVYKSHDDDYVLYENVYLDDVSITTIGKAVTHFVLWPLEFMRHSDIVV